MISFEKACRKVLSFCDVDNPTIEQAFEYKQWYRSSRKEMLSKAAGAAKTIVNKVRSRADET